MYNYNMKGWQKMRTTTIVDGNVILVLHEIRRELYHPGAFHPIYLPEKKIAKAVEEAMAIMDLSEWGFINDEVQSVGFLPDGVCQSLPNGILSAIGVLGQIAGFGEFLGIQKIDVSILQHFHVEVFIADDNTLIQTNLVRLQVDFQTRLLVELGRI